MSRRAIPTLLLAAILVGPAFADTARAMPDLHKMLMQKFDAMNSQNEGIFRHDVTDLIAPYFPVGQPRADTEKVIAAQHLGHLMPFKGTNDPGMGSMYVTKFDLASHLFSHVYVVLDFDFDGPASDMKLIHMQAFLRASNM